MLATTYIGFITNNDGLSLSIDTIKFRAFQLQYIQRLGGVGILEEDPSLNEVGKNLSHLVFSEYMDRHAENLVQLFQCSLLGFAIKGMCQPSNAIKLVGI